MVKVTLDSAAVGSPTQRMSWRLCPLGEIKRRPMSRELVSGSPPPDCRDVYPCRVTLTVATAEPPPVTVIVEGKGLPASVGITGALSASLLSSIFTDTPAPPVHVTVPVTGLLQVTAFAMPLVSTSAERIATTEEKGDDFRPIILGLLSASQPSKIWNRVLRLSDSP